MKDSNQVLRLSIKLLKDYKDFLRIQGKQPRKSIPISSYRFDFDQDSFSLIQFGL